MNQPQQQLLMWNCNGLTRHLPDIQSILLDPCHSSSLASSPLPSPPPPSVLAFVETKCDDSKSLPKIIGYSWFLHPALSTHSGGLAALVHNSYAVSTPTPVPPPLSLSDPTDSSAVLWLQIRPPHSSPFLLAIVYLRPTVPEATVDSLISSIRTAQQHSLPILLVGDFNLKHPDWNPDPSARSAASDKFHSFLEGDFRGDIINSTNASTHLQPTFPSGRSVLDLAVTDTPALVESIEFSPFEFALQSNHRPLQLTLSTSPSAASSPSSGCPRVPWDAKRAGPSDWEAFGRGVSELIPMHFPFSSLTIDRSAPSTPAPTTTHQTAQTTMLFCLTDAAETFIGVKYIQQQSVSWWKHPGVSSAYRCLRDTFAAHLHQRSSIPLRVAYYNARRAWKKIVREAKRESWSQLCDSLQQDPKSRLKWSVFKKSQSSSFAPLSSFCHPDTGALPANRKESLNNLSHAFSQSAIPPPCSYNVTAVQNEIKECLNRLEPDVPLEPHPSNDWTFTPEEVENQCRWQHTNSAPGPDTILPLFLRHGGKELYRALSVLFTFSWYHSILPEQWTQANMMALYKGKGPRNISTSFRPISMTSILIRTFEHLIHLRLSTMLEQSNFLHRHQYGFRKNHSTYDAIFHLLSLIRKEQRFKRAVPVAFLDLKKAFDRVCPDRLMHHLYLANIRGRAARWIRQFVTNRQFRVIDHSTAADWHNMEYGVPQGAVLSPLAFIVFINSAAQLIDQLQQELGCATPPVHIILFADDIAILPDTTHKDWQDNFQKALDKLTQWAAENRMQFSSDKSQIVYFNRARSKLQSLTPAFQLCGFQLEVVRHYPYLGLWLQSNLRWDVHYSHVRAAAKSDAYMIARLIRSSSTPCFPAIRALCMGYLRPRCTYAFALWRPTDKQLRSLQSLFLRPLLRVLSLPWTTNSYAVLTEANCPGFTEYRHYLLLRLLQRYDLLYTQLDQYQQPQQQQQQPPPSPPIRIHPFTISLSTELLLGLPRKDVPKRFHPTSLECLQALQDWNLQWDDLDQPIKSIMLERTYQRYQSTPSRDPTLPTLLRLLKTSPARSHFLYREHGPATSLRCRFRCGRAHTQRYLHSIQRATASDCRHPPCLALNPRPPETIQHILLECPRFDILRSQLQSSLLPLRADLTLPVLLGQVKPTRFKDNATGKRKLDWTTADAILHHTSSFLFSIHSDFLARGIPL
jgi:hypothetical protein